MDAKKRESERGPAAALPHYHGHRERLRERFRAVGPDALSDYELLEAVLFRALPRRDVKPLAKTLIATFGSFAEVITAPAARRRATISASTVGTWLIFKCDWPAVRTPAVS